MTYTFDEQIISDLHKDAYGFRPTQGWYQTWTIADNDEKQAIWDDLLVALDRAVQEQKDDDARAIEQFNTLIQKNIAIGAGDEATAIRWIIESLNLNKYDLQYGGGYVCFRLDLPYSFEEKLNPICKELLAEYEEKGE